MQLPCNVFITRILEHMLTSAPALTCCEFTIHNTSPVQSPPLFALHDFQENYQNKPKALHPDWIIWNQRPCSFMIWPLLCPRKVAYSPYELVSNQVLSAALTTRP